MAILTFWNDGKKQMGQSVAIAALGAYMALNTNYKILMFSTKHNSLTLTECFWPPSNDKISFKDKSKTDIAQGVTGLTQAILSNKTSPEIITNYTKIIFKNKLELLTDKEVPKEEYVKHRMLFKDIVKMANKYYDLVMVDLGGDLEDKAVAAILEQSNLIAVTTTQSLRLLNSYIELKRESPLLAGDKKIVMIGRYDKRSKYNLKNIERHLGEKKVYGIPYNTLYFESCNEGEVAEFFIKLRKIKPTDPNYFFIEAIKDMSVDIVEKIRNLSAQMYGG